MPEQCLRSHNNLAEVNPDSGLHFALSGEAFVSVCEVRLDRRGTGQGIRYGRKFGEDGIAREMHDLTRWFWISVVNASRYSLKRRCVPSSSSPVNRL